MGKENHPEELVAGVNRLVDLVAYQGGGGESNHHR